MTSESSNTTQQQEITNNTPDTPIAVRKFVKGLAIGFATFLFAGAVGSILFQTGSITMLTGIQWGGVGFAIGFAEGWLL